MIVKNNIRKQILKLKPYTVENFSGNIKLDAHEHPYDLPVKLKDKILKKIKVLPFNRYPDSMATQLRCMLAKNLKVNPSQIMLGNGSDELISYIIGLFSANSSRVIFPSPTFSMYSIISTVYNAIPIPVLLKNNFEIDDNKILKYTSGKNSKVIFISYPNNPTGNCFSEEKIERIISKSGCIVVLDEAYFEFSGKTFLHKLKKYPNLIILRTFSKGYGLAGLRIGYLIAKKEIVDMLLKIRLPYNLNSISQFSAIEVLKAKHTLLPKIKEIIKERNRLYEKLSEIDGIYPFKSDANFILFRVDNSSKNIYQKLKSKGILIKNLDDGRLLKNCLRVTVGTKNENNTFLKTIRRIV